MSLLRPKPVHCGRKFGMKWPRRGVSGLDLKNLTTLQRMVNGHSKPDLLCCFHSYSWHALSKEYLCKMWST